MKKLVVFIISLLTSAAFFTNAAVLEDCFLTYPPYYPPFVTGGGGEQTPPSSNGNDPIYFEEQYSSQVISGYVAIKNGLLQISLKTDLNVSSVMAVNRSTGATSSMYLIDSNVIMVVLTTSQVDGWWEIRITTTNGKVYKAEYYSKGETGILHNPGFQEMLP